MRKITKTIESGGFITEKLYIPKFTWYQKKAKIPEIEKKLHYFDGLKKEIGSLGILYSKGALSKGKTEV
jgi:hypothetical protein